MKKINLGWAMALTVAMAVASSADAEVLVGVPLIGDPDASEYDKQVQTGAEIAAAELNARGGVLGEQVRLIFDTDECKGEPAAEVAEKFVDQDVVFVAGHICSGAAIPASKVYETAGILMVSGTALNPALTDEGVANVFRLCGRSDQEGLMAASYLAEEWGDKNIAILHDGEAYGKGAAELTRAYLNRMGVQEAAFAQYAPDQDDYADLVSGMKAAGIDVLYIGGYDDEIGVIVRQAREQDYEPQLVAGAGLIGPGFLDIAGPAGEGALFTSPRDPRGTPEAAELMAAFRAEGVDDPNVDALYTYAVFQVWSQAVEAAGSFDLDKVIEALHGNEFDTLLGKIAFDGKGDVTESGFEWFVWTKDGPVPKG